MLAGHPLEKPSCIRIKSRVHNWKGQWQLAPLLDFHHSNTTVSAQVEPEVTQQHYVKGLNNLAEGSNDSPLSPDLLPLCIALANGLGRHTQPGYARPANVKLPDAEGRLCPIEHLYYVEPEFVDWLSREELPDTMRPVHSEIEPNLAAKLNVQSVRQIHEVLSTLCGLV